MGYAWSTGFDCGVSSVANQWIPDFTLWKFPRRAISLEIEERHSWRYTQFKAVYKLVCSGTPLMFSTAPGPVVVYTLR